MKNQSRLRKICYRRICLINASVATLGFIGVPGYLADCLMMAVIACYTHFSGERYLTSIRYPYLPLFRPTEYGYLFIAINVATQFVAVRVASRCVLGTIAHHKTLIAVTWNCGLGRGILIMLIAVLYELVAPHVPHSILLLVSLWAAWEAVFFWKCLRTIRTYVRKRAIAINLLCSFCRYALRALDTNKCPECGTSIPSEQMMRIKQLLEKSVISQ